MNPKRKRRLSQQDLRALGVQPGLQAVRYGPGGWVTIRQLTQETRGAPGFERRLTDNSQASEGEAR